MIWVHILPGLWQHNWHLFRGDIEWDLQCCLLVIPTHVCMILSTGYDDSFGSVCLFRLVYNALKGAGSTVVWCSVGCVHISHQVNVLLSDSTKRGLNLIEINYLLWMKGKRYKTWFTLNSAWFWEEQLLNWAMAVMPKDYMCRQCLTYVFPNPTLQRYQ